MAQVGPSEAASNLSKWAAKIGVSTWPNWLSDRDVVLTAALPVLLFYWWLYRRQRQNKRPLGIYQSTTSAPIALVVERNTSIWFVLRLVNNGPAAVFRAEIRIVETNARFHPGDVQSPLWFESARSLTVRVPSGGSEWIRIARSDVFALFRHEPHYSESAVFVESNNFDTAAQWLEFEVIVLREPPFDDGPSVARFRYAKSQWNSPTLTAVVP